MPRLSEATRSRRREHILSSAWGCFAFNGFQATSMDDIIQATGMSSSAVYRYFRSKEEMIDATAEEGLRRVSNSFVRMLAQERTPTPAQALAFVVGRFQELAADPEHDMTRIAIQTWAEALRRAPLQQHAQALYNEALDRLTELVYRWLDEGHLAPGSDPRSAAITFFTLMQGIIVVQHLVGDVDVGVLMRGLSALGCAMPTVTAQFCGLTDSLFSDIRPSS